MKNSRVPCIRIGLIASVLATGISWGANAGDQGSIVTVAEVNIMDGMNVFRRHAVPSEDMFHFYGKVLGFDQLGTYQLGNGGVTRFRVGASELKFTGREVGRSYTGGDITEATGFRLLTFFYPDRQGIEQSFTADGRQAPHFELIDGRQSALVQDPDGQWVELVIAPGQPPEYYLQIEAGLFVSDMDASRAFYSGFLGLQEIEPIFDERFGTMRIGFSRGNTTITLREIPGTVAADTGSGGIQYVVSDAPAVNALAAELGVTVDQPLYILDGFNMYFLWLEDPDGITNYFAQGNAVPREE